MKKRITALALAFVMVTGVTAFAAGTEKTISVTPMGLTINGQAVTPTKSNGEAAEVFAYDGATYVPLRYLSELLGIDVAWDKDHPDTAALVNVPGFTAPAAGTFTGTGAGFNGDIIATITVADGKITDCTLTGDGETPTIGGAALPKLQEQVKAAGSADIDGVAGATMTSNGVKAAVAAALAASKGTTGSTTEGSMTREEVVQKRAQHVLDMQAQYAPQVRTLSSGVKVQRTPQDSGVYNTRVLDSDRRGCAACHTDLAATVTNYDLVSSSFAHFPLENNLGIQYGYTQCLTCHQDSRSNPQMSTMLHGLHDNEAFRSMGGDCWSCHFVDEVTGEMQMWDVAKYNVLKGITNVAADDLDLKFTYDQNKLTDGIGFNIDWEYEVDADRVAAYRAGIKPDPATDHAAENWTIKVTGEVENEMEFNLAELIEQAGGVKNIAKTHCTINPNGGGLIANVEITGIPLRYLLDQAKIKDSATVIGFMVGDENHYGYSGLQQVDLDRYYLVYEINGEPLPYEWGYPVAAWFLDQPSACEVNKGVTEIVLRSDMDPNITHRNDRHTADGTTTNRPNEAIMNFTEGQVIEAYEPYTFEGWADAYNIGLEKIEFSFDRGATWTAYDLSETTIDRWVYWNLTWTPPAEGSYVIMVRCTAKDGLVSYRPLEMLFNAE